MIFGWMEHGKTDRYLLVDAIMPWPALHYGRAAMRAWAKWQDKQRKEQQTIGPRRMSWPCTVKVKNDGNAELNLWPVAMHGRPRSWVPGDSVWRPAMAELALVIACEIACDVKLTWLASADGAVESFVTSPNLEGLGFIGWQRGEHEPKGIDREPNGELLVAVGGAGLTAMPQGDASWL